ncbi:MAG: putative acetyltransferase [Candidatus Azotimanducaceae bacterium]|jgi:putative acetyltransferase
MSSQQQSEHSQHLKKIDKVVIRAVEPDDFIGIKEIYEQPGAYYGTLQMPYPSAQTWQERLAHTSPGASNLVACIDGRTVGNIGLYPDNNLRRRHVAYLGMGVHDEFVGRGIGQRLMDAVIDLADNWINLQRLELTVYTDNERAIRLYERMGFVREGVLRRYAFRDGEYVDALSMARLKA